MSSFSSLSYLLKRTASALNQTTSTEPPLNVKLKENDILNDVSLTGGIQSSTTSIVGYNRYLHFILGAGSFSDIAETNNSLDLTSNFTSVPTSLSKAFFEIDDKYTGKSEVRFLNETYYDADLLVQSWWNVFDQRFLRHGWGWTITLIIAYMSILVAGVIGNVMVILVVSLRHQMRTVTNMFIMNLAVADLFVIVFCVPSTLLANIFAPWILGSFMCKAVAYVQGVSVCASGYSLAAISLDRCQAVYRNYERPRGFSRKICSRTVVIIWAGALSLTIPWAVVFEIKVSEYDGLRYCVETWETVKYENMYFLVVDLACFFTIPLLLIFVSNWIIYCHVMHRDVPQDPVSSATLRKMHRHTRHVVLRMLGIVTLTFLFSWLPLHILVIIIKFSKHLNDEDYNQLGTLLPIAQWLGSWNSCINPILYAFLNKKFRRMFKSILPAWIPIDAAGQYPNSIRTPSFTTNAQTGRSLARSKTNSRSDYHRHHHNGSQNSQLKANLLFGRFNKGTGTIATTVHIISATIPATVVLISESLENILDSVIAEKITKETITAL